MNSNIGYLLILTILSFLPKLNSQNASDSNKYEPTKQVDKVEKEIEKLNDLLLDAITDEGRKVLQQERFYDVRNVKSQQFWDKISKVFDPVKAPKLSEKIIKIQRTGQKDAMAMTREEFKLFMNKHTELKSLSKIH